MALSYGLTLNTSFVSCIQNQCNLANKIISVERVSQYMDIQSEAAEVVEENRPLPDWPQDGNLELIDLKVIKYNGVLIITSCVSLLSFAIRSHNCSKLTSFRETLAQKCH